MKLKLAYWLRKDPGIGATESSGKTLERMRTRWRERLENIATTVLMAAPRPELVHQFGSSSIVFQVKRSQVLGAR